MSRPQAYSVFLSSTFEDLAAERKAVKEALNELNFPLASLGIALVPVDLSTGAEPSPPLDVCLDHVRSSDLLICLVAHRAGFLAADGRSFTETEFDEASARGIPRLAYIKDKKAFVLPEDVENDYGKTVVLSRLKRKIDAGLKRGTFAGSEQLRGHVIRDVFAWVLSREEVKDWLRSAPKTAPLPVLAEYFAAVKGDDIDRAVDVVTSHKFTVDMRRFGMRSVHAEILRDLLELDRISPPSRITDARHRARLLFEFLDHFRSSTLSAAALTEAQQLQSTIIGPDYAFALAKREASFHKRCDKAVPALKRMLRAAWGTGDLHTRAQGYRAVANYFDDLGQHERSLRWYWHSIHMLCAMAVVCPHCLGMAFLGAAANELATHDCSRVNDRLLKAYLIGPVVPDREMQAAALESLSSHFAQHDQLDEAVAVAVVASRLNRELSPVAEDGRIEVVLAAVAVAHGHQVVSDALSRVEGRADAILGALVEEYKLGEFTASLDLRPSTSGDHW
jgi:hypothetical protein